MSSLRGFFVAIPTAVFVIVAVAYDALPSRWNLALIIVAIVCVGGVLVTTHAARNEVRN